MAATGLDPDGLDLALGDATLRLPFPQRVTDARDFAQSGGGFGGQGARYDKTRVACASCTRRSGAIFASLRLQHGTLHPLVRVAMGSALADARWLDIDRTAGCRYPAWSPGRQVAFAPARRCRASRGGKREGNGSAERRPWRRQIRPERPRRGPLEFTRHGSGRTRHRQRRRAPGLWRRVLRRNRRAYRPQSQGQIRRRRRLRPRNRSGGKRTAACSRKNFQLLFDDFIAHAKGKTLYRSGPLRRRRPAIPDQDAGL